MRAWYKSVLEKWQRSILMPSTMSLVPSLRSNFQQFLFKMIKSLPYCNEISFHPVKFCSTLIFYGIFPREIHPRKSHYELRCWKLELIFIDLWPRGWKMRLFTRKTFRIYLGVLHQQIFIVKNWNASKMVWGQWKIHKPLD